jgi:hypothetical protein
MMHCFQIQLALLHIGGLDMSGKEIGTVLIVGGFALVVFQTTLFPKIVAHFGVTKAGGVFRTGTTPRLTLFLLLHPPRVHVSNFNEGKACGQV